MRISPRTQRDLSRIWPFGLIWLVTGWVFLLVEQIAAGPADQPDGVVTVTIPVFIFASVAVTAVGLLIGMIELVFLQDLFRKKSFLQKLVSKLFLYSVFLFGIIGITYPIAAALELQLTPFDGQVWNKFGSFLTSAPFWSTMLQMIFSLFLCLLYAGVSENLGYGVLLNFFSGKYHSPKQEIRIFMFLDMNSSTAIAERLGHMRYFELLREYYSDLSEGIVNHGGEVYQYVGDEVVISWPMKRGIRNDSCLRCFFAMREDLAARMAWYQQEFGEVPSFKAGLHVGEVTTGEIGALKKEIVFSGDVLNATSRIQGLCKHFETDLLVSATLMAGLHAGAWTVRSVGEVTLSGRDAPMELCRVEEKVTG